MAVEKIKMKCNSCGGTLDVDENKSILCCPYCGSKEMVFSDAVEIEKIKSRKEIELRNMEIEKEREDEKKTTIEFLLFGCFLLFGPLLIGIADYLFP